MRSRTANWYETAIGSDPNTANQNDDPDGDGWTLLEDYLNFMAHPYVMIQPNGSGAIDLKPYFIGFFGQNKNVVTPTFTVDADTSKPEAQRKVYAEEQMFVYDGGLVDPNAAD